MNSIRYIVLFVVLSMVMACSSQKQTVAVKTTPKSTLKTVYYQNRIIKQEVPQVVPTEQPDQELASVEPTAHAVKITAVKAAQSSSVHGKNVEHAELDNVPFVAPDQTVAAQPKSEEEKADRAGKTGLILALIGVALLLLGAAPEALALAALGALVMLFALFFSVTGLDGKNRKAAIVGLAISGFFTLAALIFALVYITQSL